MRLTAPIVLFGLALSGCVPVTSPAPLPSQSGSQISTPTRPSARTFADVVRIMEPVAERECEARTRNVNCDFQIVVDSRPDQPANAYQTRDANDRPVIAFTQALIAEAENVDELAFVMGHEASHHIAGHIDRQRGVATVGAIVFGSLASATGADSSAVKTAQDLGATVGARTFSKDYELEADALGTIIAHNAGFDPVRGAQYFARIPDPGNRFLGTHPPNAARMDTVRRTARGL
ncbi:Peptidase family M48 [Poseidonocella pacifica]|uniref:Peptidase family M48 n=1 Tax=Poseidonocella pacifica TaxID=871651 RepID=A0A1I0WJW6_9RHOB|nr:Peptidase family M48 [Poseidonocella pacifica]